MRVSSGVLRNMPLACPSGANTRPTSAKIRQAILNSLMNRIDGAHVLDLFAGTGAMGIEACSRGAASCTFLESDRRTLEMLESNLEEARRRYQSQNLVIPKLTVLAGALPQGLQRIKQNEPFDLIWLDPPYADAIKLFGEMLPALGNLLADQGLLAVESEGSDQPQLILQAERLGTKLAPFRSKTYGRTGVTIWQKMS